MEWEETGGRKRRRRAARDQASLQPAVTQLAKDLRAALLPRPTERKPRKPEWRCPACSTTNFMDRASCRWCSAARAAGPATTAAAGSGGNASKPQGIQQGAQQPRLPAGSVWANTPGKQQHQQQQAPRTPAAKVAALEQALGAARSAGASQDALSALEAEVAGARQKAADTRPLGARLDSARAKEKRMAAKVAAAEEAMQQALENQRVAVAQHEEAQAELNLLLAAQVPGDGESAMQQSARALLQALEQSSLVAHGSTVPPEGVLEAMRALQNAVGEPREEDIPAMELDPSSDGEQSAVDHQVALPTAPSAPQPVETVAESGRVAASQPLPEDFMAELRRLRENGGDDAAFAAVARQAAARQGPY